MPNNKLRVAVIGVGYLGQFHAQKYSQLAGVKLVAVSDLDVARCQQLSNDLSVQCVTNYRELIGKVDAVSVVTPAFIHYEIAKFFLENNVHVLVEKPITTELNHALELAEISKHNNCVLQVGHCERFNPVTQYLLNLNRKPLAIKASRLSVFTGRGLDVDVILDLMIHDLDIINQLYPEQLQLISATGHAASSSTHADTASAVFSITNQPEVKVELTASRISDQKMRIMQLIENDKVIHADFMQQQVRIVYSNGKQEILHFPATDLLLAEITSFIDAIHSYSVPKVSALDGICALELALRVSKNICHNW